MRRFKQLYSRLPAQSRPDQRGRLRQGQRSAAGRGDGALSASWRLFCSRTCTSARTMPDSRSQLAELINAETRNLNRICRGDFPLQPLLDLAQDHTDAAARNLHTLKIKWQEAEEKLRQLTPIVKITRRGSAGNEAGHAGELAQGLSSVPWQARNRNPAADRRGGPLQKTLGRWASRVAGETAQA